MNFNDRIIINIYLNKEFFIRLIKWFVVLLIFGLIIVFLLTIKILMITLVVSILLAFFLDPMVRVMETYNISRVHAIIITFVIAAAVAAIGIAFIIPLFSTEIQSISTNFQLKHPSALTDEVKANIEKNFPFMKQSGLSGELAAYLHYILEDLIKESIDILSEFVHIVSMVFTVPVFTFFLLKDGQRIKKAFVKLVPNRYFEMTLILIHKICHQLGFYIRGQLLDAFIIGVLSSFTLYLLNVRYAFLIGAFAGCANIIPHFGPIVGAIPAIFITLMETGSFTLAFLIAVSFITIQILDYLFISHMVVFKHIHLHPIVVFVVVFIGGYLMGAIGMVVAALLAGILKVAITELAWGFKHYRILPYTQHSNINEIK